MFRKIIVAIDETDVASLKNIVSSLDNKKCLIKIGSVAFNSIGHEAISYVSDKGFDIFLDLKLHDIQKAASELDLLPGAEDFINRVRQNFQVVILSDTFHEIAQPLMQKLGFPLLLCHNLGVEKDGTISSYNLRHETAKKQAILGFQSMGYRCFAAGDSYNDIQMFDVAEKGFFINAPEKISSSQPHIESFDNYEDLENAFLQNSIFYK